MKLERTRNAKRNVYFGLINRGVNLLFPFIVRTAMIYTLGTQYLGLSSLFTSILSVLSLTELGVGSAIVFHMYKPIADDDDEALCALLNYYRRIYRIIGIIIFVIGVSLIPFLPSLIKGSYPSDISLSLLYLLYLVDSVSSYLLFAYYGSLLNAFQRNDITSNIESVFTIIRYLMQAFMLVAFKDYLLFLIALPITTIGRNIATAFITKKYYPQYKCKGEISEDIRKDIIVKVKGMLINKIQAVTRNSFDSIFISAFLGLGLTAIYSNYYYIMSAIIGFMYIIIYSITGGIGNSVASESVEKNYADMNKINFIYLWISGWCAICLACLYQPFMMLWVGNDMIFPNSVMLLFCIYFYSLKMGDIRSVYFEVNGLWWENRYKSIAEAFANIILNYLLGRFFGVYGILLATIVTILIINFGYGSTIVFRYYFGLDKIKEYYLKNVEYIIATLINGILTYCVCSFLPDNNVGGFIGKMCICTVLPNVFYFIMYFKDKDFIIAIPWAIDIFELNRIKLFRYLKYFISKK